MELDYDKVTTQLQALSDEKVEERIREERKRILDWTKRNWRFMGTDGSKRVYALFDMVDFEQALKGKTKRDNE